MPYFENILVGVDLSHGDWMASADGDTPSHFACEQALDIAQAMLRRGDQPPAIHFLAALELDERTKWLLEQQTGEEETVVQHAEKALRHQVSAAVAVGAKADGSVVLGPSRIELLKQARTSGHDVVMVGSRGRSLLGGLIMGSTALELLRKSCCPVWVVKPHARGGPRRILVGTDFSPVCNALFDRGVELAKLFSAELHVTHVVEEAKRPFLQFSRVPDQAVQQAHDEALATARKQLDALARREDVLQLAQPLKVHLEEGVPSNVLAHQTSNLSVDLLLMGTVGWSGVPGLVIGSTAHKMLPVLECSLLTMRPDEVDPNADRA